MKQDPDWQDKRAQRNPVAKRIREMYKKLNASDGAPDRDIRHWYSEQLFPLPKQLQSYFL